MEPAYKVIIALLLTDIEIIITVHMEIQIPIPENVEQEHTVELVQLI